MTEERQAGAEHTGSGARERTIGDGRESLSLAISLATQAESSEPVSTIHGVVASRPPNQISTKRGFPVYRTNPSVPSAMTTRTKRFHVPGGKAAVIVDNSSGEIKGIGGMGFWWEEEVDSSRFVKLFLDGIKQAAGLSKMGMQVFELVYHQMRANPGSDEIKLNQYVARDHEISERTYQRGVRELLEKEFLYRSPSDGVFFVNIRFMFNGDRLAFVRTYHLKKSDQSTRHVQQELPLELPDHAPIATLGGMEPGGGSGGGGDDQSM